MKPPIEPPACRWEFPVVDTADDLAGIGADLAPGTLLAAYRSGLFPMTAGPNTLGWWSPDPRGILPPDGFHVSRSLRKSRKRFEIRVDTAFDSVVAACADPRRPHGWITPAIRAAYSALHELGWAHSVEAWSREDESLTGGLYGVAIGGLFAGESMFHVATDASKVALAACIDLLLPDGGKGRIFDIQWCTPHLATLGAIEVSRVEYLRMLDRALTVPPPAAFSHLGADTCPSL